MGRPALWPAWLFFLSLALWPRNTAWKYPWWLNQVWMQYTWQYISNVKLFSYQVTIIDDCFLLLFFFRSGSGIHRLPSCCGADAFSSTLGHLLFFHDHLFRNRFCGKTSLNEKQISSVEIKCTRTHTKKFFLFTIVFMCRGTDHKHS